MSSFSSSWATVFVDEFRAVVGVEVENDEGELLQDALQQWHQPGL